MHAETRQRERVGMQGSGGDGHLPVFVFPTSIKFFADDQLSHKQVLTLYNPYEFPLKFKVLCTSPKKYSVVDSEGSIRPKCCIDIVIRHKAVSGPNSNVTDKFRIQMHEHGNRKTCGHKEVAATLLSSRVDEDSEASSDRFQQLGAARSGHQTSAVHHGLSSMRSGNQSRGQQAAEEQQSHNVLAILVAVACTLALFLPVVDECTMEVHPGSRLRSVIPEYLHVTISQKLIFAYALGLVTMVLFRP